MKGKIGRWSVFVFALVLILGGVLYTIRESYIPRAIPELEKYDAWDPEIVKLISEMPVQDEGRLKPFSTWAKYRLYAIHSKKNIKVKVGEKRVTISPTEWMLDCMFRPKVADGLPSFRIENDEVATALGIKTGEFTDSNGKKVYKKKRDFYSYDEIENPEFIAKYDKQHKEDWKLLGDGMTPSGIEGQKSNLIRSIGEYKKQTHFMDIARFMADFVKLKDLEKEAGRKLTQEEVEKELRGVSKRIFNNMKMAIEEGNEHVINMWENKNVLELRMIPSADKDNFTWISYNVAIRRALMENSGETTAKTKIIELDGVTSFSEWIQMAFIFDNFGEEALKKKLISYNKTVKKVLLDRGEFENLEKVASEVKYFKRNYYAYAKGFFLLGCLLMISLLPSPQSKYGKIIGWATVACALTGVIFILLGVIHRYQLMERYPLGKLYDTILMITMVAVSILLFMELLSRKKLCLGVAVTLGLMGMYLASRFEVGSGKDTLEPLVAVLNSDYWLMTHVTTITIGYAGGIVGAWLSIFYLLARITGIDEGDKSFRRLMTRLAYGAACFTLIFSLVGTILGGVWANDSWGRFWGWDPKENGALMIVLWYLAVLHARLAGYIKDWGIHICMVLGANIVGFSWWGVNFLSTGLHNYGFASGGEGESWLQVYYILHTFIAIVAFGFAWYHWEMRRRKKQLRESQKDSDNDEGGDDSSQGTPPAEYSL